MTCKELPSINTEVFKHPNTYFVSLLFENRNLIRLVREKNKKLTEKNQKIDFEKERSKTISTINIGKKGCCQTVLSKLRKKLYFSSALAILK